MKNGSLRAEVLACRLWKEPYLSLRQQRTADSLFWSPVLGNPQRIGALQPAPLNFALANRDLPGHDEASTYSGTLG